MLTISEAARLLHVHSNTLRRWADKGLINSHRIAKRGDRRFLFYDIEQFLVNSQIDKQGFAPLKKVSDSTTSYSQEITDNQQQLLLMNNKKE